MECKKCVVKERWIGPGRYERVIKFCPLHAAAPKLLKACKEALQIFEDHDVKEWDATERLETAITKAEK